MRRPAIVLLCLSSLPWSGSAFAHPELSRQLDEAEARLDAPDAGAREWWRVAQLHRFRREWTEAEAAYARAVALDGSLAGIDLDLARMRLEAGSPRRALDPLSRYTARRPQDPEGWSARGRALASLGRFQEASAAYAAAVARSAPTRPSLPDDYLHGARAAEAAGKPVVEVLVRLDEGALRLHGAIALEVAALDLEERAGLVPEALARLARLEAGAHRKEPWAARRARLLDRAGRSAEAHAAWDSVLTAIAALPQTRRDAPAVRALREEAAAGAHR